MSESYRPNYNSYRDESRDPRVRSAPNELQSKSKTRSSRPPSDAAPPSSRPSNEEINQRRPLLRDIQDERDRVSSGKDGEFPTQRPNTMTPPLKSTPNITAVSEKLIIDANISDPFTCNLIVDDGKRCVKSFSGVSGVENWRRHIQEVHHKLGPGRFITKGNLGYFTPLTTEDTADTLGGLVQRQEVTTPTNVSSSFPRLGKSSLKRRQDELENSQGKTEDTVSAKKSRMNDETSKNVDLGKVLAKMQSYKPLQNFAESHQPMTVSKNRNQLESSPPPPPPPLPASISIQRWADKPLASSINVDLESLSHRKAYIYEMHRSGFSPENIQKAFKKLHNVDISSEIIRSVVAEYGSMVPLETQSRPVATNTLITHARSRSSSTTTSSIPVIKNDTPLHQPQHQESPLPVTDISNIFIPLENMSTEQTLKALESLQSLLPEKIEQVRMKIQEEQVEQERRRKEEEDEIVRNHITEIQRKLDELDRMKRGDALDILNKEIERKRSGLTKRSTESPLIPPNVEPDGQTAMLVDEIVVPQVKVMETETIQRENLDSSIIEGTEKMDIDRVQSNENDDRQSSDMDFNTHPIDREMDTDTKSFFESRDDKEPRHPLQMGESAMEDSHTNDSTSSSVAHHSLEKKLTLPSVTRQDTFAESTQTQRNTTILRKYSLPSLKERITDPYLSDGGRIDPENPRIASSISQSPSLETGQIDTLAQKTQITGPIAYHRLSKPATVLLTNTYDEWSNFCVALGSDGNIDLLDNRSHDSAKGKAKVWCDEYTASFAINGAWIGPGELALIHKTPWRNRDGNQISLIKYKDTQFTMKPQITPLRLSPHSTNSKITAITPLWMREEQRSFATGDDEGRIFLWQIGSDSSVTRFSSIHKYFLEMQVGALTYNPSKAWLLSASRSRLYITDFKPMYTRREFTQVRNHIVSISPNPMKPDLTMVTIRDKYTPLALLDHRLPGHKAVVETYEYPSAMGDVTWSPWNHSGTWKSNCGNGNYFILGGYRDVHIWDIRSPFKPVSSIDLGLGMKMVVSTKMVEHELLAMTGEKLVWAKPDEFALL